MKPLTTTAAVALLLTIGLFAAGPQRSPQVEIARLTEQTWDRYAPRGKEADAIYGDLVLRNEHLTAVIAKPDPRRHANMTVRDIRGALIDLTARGAAAESDQLAAFYPGKREFPFLSWTAATNGGRTLDPSELSVASGKAGEVTVHAPAAEERPAVDVTYRLESGARHLEVTTKYTNAGDKPLTVRLEDEIRADAGKENMPRSANGTHGLFWIDDRHWGQAYGIDAPQHQVESNTRGNTTILRYPGDEGADRVMLAPGESFELTRRITPGSSLIAVRAAADRLRGETLRPVRIAARDGNDRPLESGLLELYRGDQLYGTALTGTGEIAVELPAGTYRAELTALGQTVIGADQPVTFTVRDAEAPQEVALRAKAYRPGRVAIAATDAEGRPLPCKVQFAPKDGTPEFSFGPETADLTGVKNVFYYVPSENAPHAVTIPSGTYDVTVSRGPEYDAVVTELTVPPGGTAQLNAKLPRPMETTGWVSADFHSHSSPSGDNTSSQVGRVLNLVCEHIEFAPCTEHNRIDSYRPIIEALDLEPYIATTSGIELTGKPLPLNHQNAFPLRHKPHEQDGGGPVTDDDPEQQIERLALWDDRSEKLIQQNHPDVGWLFYDRDGDGRHDHGFERGHVHIDVMEIHPIDSVLELGPVDSRNGKPFGNHRIFNWLQLLNQGYRIPGVVNTDAHYNYHGSGGLRNWIASSTDDPARIDTHEMVHAAEDGRLVMSNGPLLEFHVRETGGDRTVTAGEDLAAPSRKVTAHVRVQCPNWLDVDRVFLLVNGREHPIHSYTRAKNPDLFADGVVKFDRELPLELESDAHVIAVTGGEHLKVGPVMGPQWGAQRPAALSNPVFIDVDGNGFRPNKDTLGHPLPVKFEAAK